jgi:SAM-dependent methyltransferase
MPKIVNEEQAHYWSEEIGAKWRRRGADMDSLLAGTTGILLDSAAPESGEKVLDIGCGSGPSSFAAARLVGPSGQVHGVDISANFVQQAQAEAKAADAANVTFEHADAQSAEFQPEKFDLVISRFGSMFFNDPVAAFTNIAKALKRGGRLALLCWSGPQHNPWFSMTRQVAIDHLGPVAAAAPDAPGPMAFQDIGRVRKLLAAAGFSGAEGREADIELIYPGSAAQLADLATEMGGSGSVVRELGASDEVIEAIRTELENRLGVWAKPDGVHLPARLNVFTARREMPKPEIQTGSRSGWEAAFGGV